MSFAFKDKTMPMRFSFIFPGRVPAASESRYPYSSIISQHDRWISCLLNSIYLGTQVSSWLSIVPCAVKFWDSSFFSTREGISSLQMLTESPRPVHPSAKLTKMPAISFGLAFEILGIQVATHHNTHVKESCKRNIRKRPEPNSLLSMQWSENGSKTAAFGCCRHALKLGS